MAIVPLSTFLTVFTALTPGAAIMQPRLGHLRSNSVVDALDSVDIVAPEVNELQTQRADSPRYNREVSDERSHPSHHPRPNRQVADMGSTKNEDRKVADGESRLNRKVVDRATPDNKWPLPMREVAESQVDNNNVVEDRPRHNREVVDQGHPSNEWPLPMREVAESKPDTYDVAEDRPRHNRKVVDIAEIEPDTVDKAANQPRPNRQVEDVRPTPYNQRPNREVIHKPSHSTSRPNREAITEVANSDEVPSLEDAAGRFNRVQPSIDQRPSRQIDATVAVAENRVNPQNRQQPSSEQLSNEHRPNRQAVETSLASTRNSGQQRQDGEISSEHRLNRRAVEPFASREVVQPDGTVVLLQDEKQDDLAAGVHRSKAVYVVSADGSEVVDHLVRPQSEDLSHKDADSLLRPEAS